VAPLGACVRQGISRMAAAASSKPTRFSTRGTDPGQEGSLLLRVRETPARASFTFKGPPAGGQTQNPEELSHPFERRHSGPESSSGSAICRRSRLRDIPHRSSASPGTPAWATLTKTRRRLHGLEGSPRWIQPDGPALWVSRAGLHHATTRLYLEWWRRAQVARGPHGCSDGRRVYRRFLRRPKICAARALAS